MTTMKQSISADEAKQKYFDAVLRENRISAYMQAHGCDRDTAEAAVGKSATALASIEALADADAVSIAKFLETPTGSLLYSEFAAGEIEPSLAKRALDQLAQAHRVAGESKWTAMNKALNSKLGRELYSRSQDA